MRVIETIKFIQPTELKIATTLLLSIFTFFFGSVYIAGITAVVMLFVFDTVMGTMASVHEGDGIESRRLRGMFRKGIVYLIAISSAYYADTTLPFAFIQVTMIGFVGVTEFVSILENAGRMGYKTPQKLLFQLKDFQSKK